MRFFSQQRQDLCIVISQSPQRQSSGALRGFLAQRPFGAPSWAINLHLIRPWPLWFWLLWFCLVRHHLPPNYSRTGLCASRLWVRKLWADLRTLLVHCLYVLRFGCFQCILGHVDDLPSESWDGARSVLHEIGRCKFVPRASMAC